MAPGGDEGNLTGAKSRFQRAAEERPLMWYAAMRWVWPGGRLDLKARPV
jgi:hypothetical protein